MGNGGKDYLAKEDEAKMAGREVDSTQSSGSGNGLLAV
jgi:hypothetical protein